MRREHVQRINQLRDRWVSEQFILEQYGIQLPNQALLGGFRAWADNLAVKRQVAKPGGQYDRWAFETYLQQSRLLPKKLAAVQLGMTRESLDKVLSELSTRSLFTSYAPDDELFREEDVRNFHRIFADTRFRIFRDHKSFCRRLHAAIKKLLNYKVVELRCITSTTAKDQDSDYAHDFDCITLDPVGLRYQVWLDFGKPMHLQPDVCSSMFYVRERRHLSTFVLGDPDKEICDEVAAKLETATAGSR